MHKKDTQIPSPVKSDIFRNWVKPPLLHYSFCDKMACYPRRFIQTKVFPFLTINEKEIYDQRDTKKKVKGISKPQNYGHPKYAVQ